MANRLALARGRGVMQHLAMADLAPAPGATPRPTDQLETLQQQARPIDEALDSRRLGLVRATRHSFARSMLRAAAADGWAVTTERFDIDEAGRGDIIYRVDLGPDCTVRLVAFSNVIDESERTDRVVADTWDLTASLCEGDVSDARLELMRSNVTAQEGGRAQSGALVWTRANRSARYFDYVVDTLASGHQPDPARLGDAAYVMRSTAFYANGKWGLADFGGIDQQHPLHLPYRAQMLTAWLIRELSLDLVERCAVLKNATASKLDDTWRRFFGLGNATGLGMVPFVINHPVVFDSWVAMRELPLAHALATNETDAATSAPRLIELLERAITYFSERPSLETAPYPQGPELAEKLKPALHAALAVANSTATEPLRTVHESVIGPAQAVVEAILIELDDSLDDELEHLLLCPEPARADPAMTCGELSQLIAEQYHWTETYDFDNPESASYFWFYSADSQEPRRGVRGRHRGADTEMAIDVARAVRALSQDLATDIAPDLSVAHFLLQYPWHRGAIDRVCGLAAVRYGEARVNPLADDFLPLELQRFQLAAYGMENFSPQSTDWLRVTLFSGAPRASDVAAGVDDDWTFTPKPQPKSTPNGG